MHDQLPTHVLRLSDVYLVAAEAAVLTGDAATAKKYVNMVRARAGVSELDNVTFNDVWKERRLELALEGDRWFDYVRRSYYDADACIAELKAQRRSPWANGSFDTMHKAYILDAEGNYAGPGTGDWDASAFTYNGTEDLKNVNVSMFTLPVPTDDVVMNPKVGTNAEVIDVDVRAEYKYNF